MTIGPKVKAYVIDLECTFTSLKKAGTEIDEATRIGCQGRDLLILTGIPSEQHARRGTVAD